MLAEFVDVLSSIVLDMKCSKNKLRYMFDVQVVY